MAKAQFFCNLMDHFSFKGCGIVDGESLGGHLFEDLSEVILDASLFFLSMFSPNFFLFEPVFLFLLFVFGFLAILVLLAFLPFVVLYLVAGADAEPYFLILLPLLGTRDVAMFLDPVHQGVYVAIGRYALDVADEDQHSAGSSDCHVHPSPVFEEADFSF
jgi:hypothetical protein